MPSRRSIRDVAVAAGVSITTVSRVLNNVEYPVSADVRVRVIQTAKDLNYSPNRSAQSLRRSSTDVIGLLVREIDYSYFGQIARGVTERALEKGSLAFVCNTARIMENEIAYHELLWQHRVKGVIIAGGGIIDPRYVEIVTKQQERMTALGLRVVAVAPQGIEMPCLCCDHTELGRRMTEYLIDAGHRKIGFVAGPSNVVTTAHHIEGYRIGLEQAGISFDGRLVTHGSFDEEGGDTACRELLKRGAEFTALCAGNDNMAVGATNALEENGLRVPMGVSIVGIGDTSAGRYSRPQITTFNTFRSEMGRRAVDYVLGEVHTPGSLEPKLIERDSVKRT